MSNSEPRSYTIDDLAAATRVPSRTIRFYQSKGALPPPEIRGRTAYYDDRHIERLKLIAQLQDRGLNIRAIRDLMQRLDHGHLDLAEWLGLDQRLQAPWSSDAPAVYGEADMAGMVADLRPGLVADLIEQRVIERRGASYYARSPALLQITLAMERAGIDPALAGEAGRILRRTMARAAAELAEHFLKHAGKGFGRAATAEDLQAAYDVLQPVGLEAIQLIFGQEMEKVLRRMAGEGRSATLLERPKS